MATATAPYDHINLFPVRLIPEGFEKSISPGSIPVSTMMSV